MESVAEVGQCMPFMKLHYALSCCCANGIQQIAQLKHRMVQVVTHGGRGGGGGGEAGGGGGRGEGEGGGE